ncbi:MAG: T9SS type A sorting domain-containing protein [Salibacteraceae bacterium]|nr:T9SS type A sorting domain-containing protein [Salibacteraceae bacterium]
MKSKILPLIFFLSAISLGHSQTGPSGIGTTDGTSILKLWFDGEDIAGDGSLTASGADVSSWLDKSGNATTVNANISNIATFSSPGVTFNNTGYLLGSDLNLPTGNASRTLIVVAASPSTTVDDCLFFYGATNWSESFGLIKQFQEYARLFFFGDDLNDNVGWSSGTTTKIVNATYSSGSPGTRYIHVDNQQTATDIPAFTPITNVGTEGLQIGGWNSYGLFSNATIYEILFYSSELNQAQRIIVNNYLAAKYGLSLAADDIYNEDDAGYRFEVAGIGKASDGSNHPVAQGTGMVEISNASGLDLDEFLFWGHNADTAKAINITDVPSGVESRFARVWRVSESNSSGVSVDVGTIDMTWNLTGLGSVNLSDLCLLVDSDNDGVFSDETPIFGATTSDFTNYTFSNISAIGDNMRFTLGTADTNQTPLPIELLSFNAEVNAENGVELYWITASEVNNDYFLVESSYDALNWETIGIVDGAGNSNTETSYSFLDSRLHQQTIYYRLKQHDFDSKHSYSNVVTVLNNQKRQVTCYPNPTSDKINLMLDQVKNSDIQIFNLLGENVTQQAIIDDEKANTIVIDLSALESGMYLIKSKNEQFTVGKL